MREPYFPHRDSMFPPNKKTSRPKWREAWALKETKGGFVSREKGVLVADAWRGGAQLCCSSAERRCMSFGLLSGQIGLNCFVGKEGNKEGHMERRR